jgi:hypothetical protein
LDFSEQVQTYLSSGPSVGFLIDKTENVENVENVQPGVNFEMGLRNTNGSFFGLFYANPFSSYALNNLVIHIGLSFRDIKLTAAKVKAARGI